jgi:hypothetical protein
MYECAIEIKWHMIPIIFNEIKFNGNKLVAISDYPDINELKLEQSIHYDITNPFVYLDKDIRWTMPCNEIITIRRYNYER